MAESTRETQLFETIVMLADTLVADFDVVDLLQTLVDRSGDLLGAEGAGILLTGPAQRLQVIAATDDGPGLHELLLLSGEAGPCGQCVREARVVAVPDIAALTDWPDFRDGALELGFRAVHAVPLRLRDRTIGAMGLFEETPGELDTADLSAAQALADVATIGILQERAIHEADLARRQLQHALDSRVTIEQAKGVIAYRHNVEVSEAFDLIRRYARDNRLGLSEVADQIVRRKLDLGNDRA
jgi:GAF domain-containing protein